MPLPRVVSLALLALLLTASCSGGSDLTAGEPDLEALAAAPLVELDGSDASPLDLSGPVAVWFTTPWCRRCEDQLRDALTAAAGRCDARLVVVVGRAGEGAIGQFLDANTVPTSCGEPPRIVTDPTGTAFGSVPVVSAPTWLFVGEQVEVDRGSLSTDELDRRLAL